MMHWAAEYVGKRHVPGGRGPETFDCWGLLRWIYIHRYGLSLPSLPGISSNVALRIAKEIAEQTEKDWDQVDEPFDGCAVAMSQSSVYHHVGVFIEADGRKVLHCWDTDRVIVDSLLRLRLKGMRRVDFFRHRKWPT